MKVLKIHDPMFSLPISLFVGTREEYLVFVKDAFGKEGCGSSGHTMSDGCVTTMWVKDLGKPQALPLLIHELTHHAWNVAHFRGVPLNTENDEVYAYYMEMMFRSIMKQLKAR